VLKSALMIVPILKAPNKRLSKPCEPVTEFDDYLGDFVQDLIETMHHAPTGIGLSAPQVGLELRFMVIDVSKDRDNPIVFVNPVISSTRGATKAVESCLSIPGVEVEVFRPKVIKVTAQRPNGEFFKKKANGLLARVICHEVDHLNGILITDKARA